MTIKLNIQGLHKAYKDKKALQNVTLQIPEGKIFGLLGPNGAGKSTLIRIINRIIEKDQGVVSLNGNEMTDIDVQKIGYLPEERGLYKNMTIEDQALYLAQLKGLTKNEAQEKLDFWLNRFEILDWKKKKIQELSKGMAQKVQFIITVLHEPELLILDEPFSGFDPVNAQLIAKEILRLKKQGTTIIFSTHRMESVEELCDDICLMNHGNILVQGEINEVRKQFSESLYQLQLKGINTIPTSLSKYDIILKDETFFISLDSEQSSNQLLLDAINAGEVNYFSEVIPSVNDIFIKLVGNE